MRKSLAGLSRYIATPEVSKHRIFVWVEPRVLCNQQTLVFAREDDYFFGVLQSRVHEVWARATGTQLREVESGFRYTPTTTFETFPFPQPTDAQREAIATAASALDRLRQRWLNPSGVDEGALKRRTLTELYNQRRAWLDQAHHMLDSEVFAAYGWTHHLTDEELLKGLLELDLERAGIEAAT
jgi:type II restriction/modification system DNA methylase subunit YeeA